MWRTPWYRKLKGPRATRGHPFFGRGGALKTQRHPYRRVLAPGKKKWTPRLLAPHLCPAMGGVCRHRLPAPSNQNAFSERKRPSTRRFEGDWNITFAAGDALAEALFGERIWALEPRTERATRWLRDASAARRGWADPGARFRRCGTGGYMTAMRSLDGGGTRPTSHGR